MKQPIAAVMTTTLLCAALVACGDNDKPQAAPVRPVRLLTVGNDGATPALDFAGVVKARVESRLGFRVGGKILAREVQAGQHVSKGQELMRLDPRDYQLSELAAKSAADSAKASLEVAQTEYNRFKSLREKGFVSETDLDRKRSELAAAQAQFTNARSSSDIEANRVSDAVLRADVDGVVETINADAGEVVSTGQPVVTVARDGEREIEIDFPEDKTPLAKVAQAQVALWARPDIWFPAHLRELAAAADPVSRTFRARYTVDAPAGALALGQSASLRLKVPAMAATGAGVYLPLSALVGQQNQTEVWRYDPGSSQVARVPVTVLGVDGNRVLVAGLAGGMQVVTAGVHVLSDGQKVRPMEANIPAEAVQP